MLDKFTFSWNLNSTQIREFLEIVYVPGAGQIEPFCSLEPVGNGGQNLRNDVRYFPIRHKLSHADVALSNLRFLRLDLLKGIF